MQVLHELAQGVLIALCFAGDLVMLSIAVLLYYGNGIAYTSITLVLHVSSQFQTLSLFSCEGAKADALHLAGDFELDL